MRTKLFMKKLDFLNTEKFEQSLDKDFFGMVIPCGKIPAYFIGTLKKKALADGMADDVAKKCYVMLIDICINSFVKTKQTLACFGAFF